MALNGETERFDREFMNQTDNAIRYYQFAEIYHPLTGEIYGGRQERGKREFLNGQPNRIRHGAQPLICVMFIWILWE